ncbi:MAG: fibronectin type III domain-containing protein, partial [Candidatus Thermoplasmatota archaeon]
IDKTKPITSDNVKIGWQKEKPIKIVLQANDNLSGIKETYYKIWSNGSEEPKNWSIGNETNIEDDGKWLIKYYSVDNAGNEEEIKIKELWIDTIAPEKPELNITIKGSSIILSWRETIEQNFERYEIHIARKKDFSNERIINITDKKITNYTLNLTAGKKYYLKLKVIDLAGWESESDLKELVIPKKPIEKKIDLEIILPILLLLCLCMFIVIGYKLRGRKKFVAPVQKFAVEEVFLIYNDGRLLAHTTRRLKADMDEDILSSMLTAVQTFIKDSFGKEEKGELTSMQYGDNRILFEKGKNTVLAVVITGEEAIGLRGEMRTALNNIETEYGTILKDWSGSLSEIAGAKKFLSKLGEYELEPFEEKIKIDVKLMSEVEFYRGFVRLKVAVKNSTSAVITNASLKIIYDEEALRLDHIEPEYSMKGNDIIIGIVEPNEKKTIGIFLDPKICMESYIDGILSFKDYKGNLEMVKMKRKLASVVCPIMYTDENINVPMLKRLVAEELEQNDSKVFTMPNIQYERVYQCTKKAVQRHDVRLVREFIEKEPYSAEVWYFGKTKERKDKLVIRCSVREEGRNVEFFVASNSILV